MYWTLELAISLEDAPWPATKEELIDYATRSGAPMEVIENLQEIEDEGDVYVRRLRTRAMCTNPSKKSGPTIHPKKTSYSTRMNTN